MNNYIKERVLNEAAYIIETKETIRNTANNFKVSKSTVHKDISERLFLVDKKLYSKVKEIMDYHIEVRHILGGESTRKKYRSH